MSLTFRDELMRFMIEGGKCPLCEEKSEGMVELLSISEVARLFKIPAKWLRERVEDGSVPCLRIGNRIRLSPSAVSLALERMANCQ